MDIIYIKGLQIETIIGIYDWERNQKQLININLEMATNIKLASKTQDINHTLNYKEISERLIDFIEKSSFLLIETMAEEICKMLMSKFKIKWLKLNLSKPNALPNTTNVGLIIERGNKF